MNRNLWLSCPNIGNVSALPEGTKNIMQDSRCWDQNRTQYILHTNLRVLHQNFRWTTFFQNFGTHQTRRRHILEECETKDIDLKVFSCTENVTKCCKLRGGGGEIGCSKWGMRLLALKLISISRKIRGLELRRISQVRVRMVKLKFIFIFAESNLSIYQQSGSIFVVLLNHLSKRRLLLQVT
jgi:hypothetical protein